MILVKGTQTLIKGQTWRIDQDVRRPDSKGIDNRKITDSNLHIITEDPMSKVDEAFYPRSLKYDESSNTTISRIRFEKIYQFDANMTTEEKQIQFSKLPLLRAYDCSAAKINATYKLKDISDCNNNLKLIEEINGPSTQFQILQKNRVMEGTAVKCLRKRTYKIQHCGDKGFPELHKEGYFNRIIEVSPGECLEMWKQQAIYVPRQNCADMMGSINKIHWNFRECGRKIPPKRDDINYIQYHVLAKSEAF